MSDIDSNFLSRWSRRKVQARHGEVPAEPPPAEVPPASQATTLTTQSVDAPTTAPDTPPERPQPPPPTLADVATLTRESDFSRFVAPGVDGDVKNAALRKLFADPHFNVMDGLDTYIDDYSKPDPLPASMLRQMTQAAFLGLVGPEEPAAAAAAAAPNAATAAATPTAQAPNAEVEPAVRDSAATPEPDENADLRLQPHDAARRGGAEDSAAADSERQH